MPFRRERACARRLPRVLPTYRADPSTKKLITASKVIARPICSGPGASDSPCREVEYGLRRDSIRNLGTSVLFRRLKSPESDEFPRGTYGRLFNSYPRCVTGPRCAERAHWKRAWRVHLLLSNIVDAWIGALFLCAAMWTLERLFPGRPVSLSSQIRSLKFWLISGLGTGAAVTLLQYVNHALQPHPLFVIPLNLWFSNPSVHWLIYVVQPLLGVILYDFFDYWMHRAEHRWFWQQHAIHHSIGELSGINSYFHWTEPFLRMVFIRLPAAYIVGTTRSPHSSSSSSL